MNETQDDKAFPSFANNDADDQHARDDATMQEPVASNLREAETVHTDLAPYSLTREQVVELYKVSGIDVKPRTVSFYAKEGKLRAVKVEAKNGLERYLYDGVSVEEDIARRKNYERPDTLYVGTAANDATRMQDDVASSLHGAKSEHEQVAPSMHARLDNKDIKIAKLETALEYEQRERANAERKLTEEVNRTIGMARKIGEYETRIGDLQSKLALIAGPKPEPEPEAAADEDERSLADPTPPAAEAVLTPVPKRRSFLDRILGRE